MIVIRCTSKLLARLLPSKPTVDPGKSTNLLGDFYATLVHTRRGQFVIAMASATLLPVVVTGRDLRAFPERVSGMLAEVLASYGVPESAIRRECAAMSDVHYARTNDRSLVGVLTDYQRLFHGELEHHPAASLKETSLRLAQTPIVARDTFPDDATCRLFGVPPPTVGKLV